MTSTRYIGGMETQSRANVWSSVKEDLEIRIAKGDLAPAERTPSISDLAAFYGKSEKTVHKALLSLCDDGVLFRKDKIGFYLKIGVAERLKQQLRLRYSAQISGVLATGRAIGFSDEEIERIFYESLTPPPLFRKKNAKRCFK